MSAARQNRTQVVERLVLSQGVDVNAIDSNGDTALCCTSQFGSLAMVRWLLVHVEGRADVNVTDEHDWASAYPLRLLLRVRQ